MSESMTDGSAKTIALQSSLSTTTDGPGECGRDGDGVTIGDEDSDDERGGMFFASSCCELLDARLL